MKKYFLSILCLFTAFIFCFSGCTFSAEGTVSQTGEPAPSKAEAKKYDSVKAKEAEASCLSFVSRMLTRDGGICTNNIGAEGSEELASGREVLSESEGLMLCYYAAASDREQFEKPLSFIKSKLDSGTIISYRLREDGSRFSVNATVDDLRILRGLTRGASEFSEPDYQALCGSYAERLYSTNVEDNLLLDFYDEASKSAGRACTLCYSDFKTMELIGEHDNRWLKVENKMLEIAEAGYISDEFPFFRKNFEPAKKQYSDTDINMVEALLTALHLSEVGKCPSETVRWLQDALSSGGSVCGEYTEHGKPSTKVESTAVYALCSLLGISENKPELVFAAMDKLYALQITDTQSELYGAFADAATGTAYSFDNLMALTAMRAQDEYFTASEGGAE